ncbi:kinase-like domain-containing protein [Hygrophoropsis aurantiaca]|uniref:Kinase-like domain-containing protein n=1 Tax=Hygrophoropsis aurantiaca TaxID=72124 RepID=A0ACB7ZWK5_9AGAM|nr:kinase-like domain-containing protein [Hygrophoropsis aurantiaca]
MPRIIRVNGRYRLRELVGQGAYGKVYRATDLASGEDVVVKMERIDVMPATLEHEYTILRQLEGLTGIPCAHWFGEENKFNALVLDCLGPSLDKFFNNNCTISAVTTVISQLLHRLQSIHARNFIHRDVKPSNALIGVGGLVYLIDFSVAMEYRNPKTRLPYPLRQHLPFVGTPTYASINSHLGYELSRRDDLESLAYTMIYLFRGSLPWETGPFTDILEQKRQVHELCPDLPNEIKLFMDYTRSLEFSSKPDYEYLHGLLKQLSARPSEESDIILDGNGCNTYLDWYVHVCYCILYDSHSPDLAQSLSDRATPKARKIAASHTHSMKHGRCTTRATRTAQIMGKTAQC